MERIVEQTLLYDFYGELLTEHQKRIYEAAVFEDMSYTEIAEEEGISRQGVFDLVKRCNHILEGYEEKLHLVEKFLENRKRAEQISVLAGELTDLQEHEAVREIIRLAEAIAADR
jgi:hypothetical protein